ncbi:hypothetical protein BH23BAC1_BH23BAC1_45450 [soil metagenome]
MAQLLTIIGITLNIAFGINLSKKNDRNFKIIKCKFNFYYFFKLYMNAEVQYWINRLNLQPHPEGGYYVETYRAEGKIKELDRHYSTGIYFLLLEDHFSAFHRIRFDEMWHFYAGSAIEVIVLKDNGELHFQKLGINPELGEKFQLVVPGGNWFASRMVDQTSYGLVGCTVAPGFDFKDFEMAKRNDLTSQFPHHKKLIHTLTYPD